MKPSDCSNNVCLLSEEYKEKQNICDSCKMKNFRVEYKEREDRIRGFGFHFGKRVDEFCLEM